MKRVSIKQFDVEMVIKNKGIELDIYDDDVHLGDLIVTKSKLIWCEGRTRRESGKEISWDDFREFMNDRP